MGNEPSSKWINSAQYQDIRKPYNIFIFLLLTRRPLRPLCFSRPLNKTHRLPHHWLLCCHHHHHPPLHRRPRYFCHHRPHRHDFSLRSRSSPSSPSDSRVCDPAGDWEQGSDCWPTSTDSSLDALAWCASSRSPQNYRKVNSIQMRLFTHRIWGTRRRDTYSVVRFPSLSFYVSFSFPRLCQRSYQVPLHAFSCSTI